MTNDKITSVSEPLNKGTETMKQDDEQITEHFKKQGHIDEVEDRVDNMFDLTLDYINEHPSHLNTAPFPYWNASSAATSSQK
jgi:hypothetical protein